MKVVLFLFVRSPPANFKEARRGRGGVMPTVLAMLMTLPEERCAFKRREDLS